jgi:hypothetical protein
MFFLTHHFSNHLKECSYFLSMNPNNPDINVQDKFYKESTLAKHIQDNPHVRVRNIPNCKKYLITSDGKPYSIRTDKFLKVQYHNSHGCYGKVFVDYKDNKRNMRVHRLVALAFLHNPNNLTDVDHINCDRSDNNLSNLRWVTHAENMRNLKCHQKYPLNFLG